VGEAEKKVPNQQIRTIGRIFDEWPDCSAGCIVALPLATDRSTSKKFDHVSVWPLPWQIFRNWIAESLLKSLSMSGRRYQDMRAISGNTCSNDR
jgi:hypothetical protein